MARRSPVPSDDALRRARIERYGEPPSRSSVVLRPFGYLLVTAVWTVLFALAVFLPFVLPAELASSGDGTSSQRFIGLDPVQAVLLALVLAVLAGPILGYVILTLPLATGPLAILSATYVVRSLRPSYRGERLSATGWSRGTIGFGVVPTALSLIPVRMTAWTAFWTALYTMGWRPSGRLFLAAVPAGLGYLVTVGWVLWPIEDPLGVTVWSAVSVLLGLAAAVLVLSDARHRFLRRSAHD